MRSLVFALLVPLLMVTCEPLCAAEEPLRRGWLSPPEDLMPGDLPAGIIVMDQRERRLFVELPEGSLPGLRRQGFRFREVPESWMLSVGGERFDVRQGEPALAPEWRIAGSEPGLRPYLIKFRAPPDPEWYEEMERDGALPVQYLPSFGYLVFLRAGSERGLARRGQVEFHGEYHPGYKANPSLRDLSGTDQRITLRLIYFDLPGWGDALDAALGTGARLVHRSDAAATSQRKVLHYAIVEDVSMGQLPELLASPSLYWAERWFPPHPEGERAAQITAGNVSGGAPLPDYYAWLAQLGADGSGITVAVADTGLDTGDPATIHPDFFGRVTFATALCADSADTDGHGTNVAAIAVGDPRALSGGTGLLDPAGFHWGAGSAPGSSLYFQTALKSLCIYNNDAATLAADAVGVGGAHIGSHSFTDGQGSLGGYNSQAQAWDGMVRDADPVAAGNQQYAVLFSAGNLGFSGLTSPKAAKNIITVGATENYRIGECPGGPCSGEADDIDQVAAFSSWGPTGDERLKPDVVAPGHVIVGAYSSMATYLCTCDPGEPGGTCCDSQGVDGTLSYSRYSGTSQAAPRVAGASALIFEWFQQRQGVLPSPAMNKAVLINSAVDLKDPDVPNLIEGWGRVSLGNVLQAPEGVELVDQTTILQDTGDPGAFNTSFFVQDPGLPLKTTLVWTDPPSAINCRPCLLNDLDLLLTNGGSTWLGNNFADGFSTTGTVADFRNNVEQIHLPPLAVDCSLPIEVKVRADALNGDGVPGNADATDQDFALVLRNAGASPGPPFVLGGPLALNGGCDADAYLDRTETVAVTLDLENRGCRLATGVSAVLRVAAAPAGAVVTVSPSTPLAIPDITAAGASQGTWQVTLDDSATDFCGLEVVLEVEVTDDAGGNWVDTVRLNTDGDGTALIPHVDAVDTDQSASADPAWRVENCRVSSSPDSWHMGSRNCSGVPRDGLQHTLVFEHTLLPTDELHELSFRHAFNAYSNGSFFDTAQIEIDHDGDGFYTVLELWFDGINNPGVMTMAGPYDLSGFEQDRAETVSIRFRFRSATQWPSGPNTAAGWDVDDITLTLREVQCDPQTCVACSPAPPPVPDGTSGGNPLTVEHAGSDLRLSWDSVSGASGFNLYSGTLGSWYSHTPFNDPLLQGGESCSEGVLSTVVTMPPGDTYFLVTSDSGCRESGYGEGANGSPRPAAPVPCNPQ